LAPETGSDAVAIEVRVRQVAQLFNSLDPSPFHERDLDDEAEEFIVGWARELPRRDPIRIIVHLPEDEARIAEETDLAGTLRHYFAGRVQRFERDIRELFRTGRRHLGVGLLMLVLCLAASQLIASFVTVEPLASIISESLVIVGWVANWKPIEIFLYEWWPIRRKISLYERLRDAEVSIHPD
jgi:hypothetical protein